MESPLDQNELQSIVNTGVYSSDLRRLGIDHKFIFTLPEELKEIQLYNTTDVYTQDETEEIETLHPDTLITNDQFYMSPSYATLVQPDENQTFYATTPIKEALYYIDALPTFLALIKSEDHREYAFKFICEYITKMPQNYEHF